MPCDNFCIVFVKVLQGHISSFFFFFSLTVFFDPVFLAQNFHWIYITQTFPALQHEEQISKEACKGQKEWNFPNFQ